MSLNDEARFGAGAGSLFAPGRSFTWNLVSTRLTQFSYFDRQLGSPGWKGRKILDFGGNVGTFLVAAGDHVDHEDYWCIDLNPAVLEEGRRTYPRAHFVHYNRYSSQYNPNGVRYLPIPDCGVEFDIIVAFSVFTHTDRSEMLELVGALRSMLTRDGVLAFTFFDPHYDRSQSDPDLPAGTSALQTRFVSRKGGEAVEEAQWYVLIDDVRFAVALSPPQTGVEKAQWYVLIDDHLYVEPGDHLCHQTRVGKPLESYISYFTAEYMASLFPDARVLPPVSPEWQHCCVFKKSA